MHGGSCKIDRLELNSPFLIQSSYWIIWVVSLEYYCRNVGFQDSTASAFSFVLFHIVLGVQARCFGSTFVLVSLGSLVSPGFPIHQAWEDEILYCGCVQVDME